MQRYKQWLIDTGRIAPWFSKWRDFPERPYVHYLNTPDNRGQECGKHKRYLESVFSKWQADHARWLRRAIVFRQMRRRSGSLAHASRGRSCVAFAKELRKKHEIQRRKT